MFSSPGQPCRSGRWTPWGGQNQLSSRLSWSAFKKPWCTYGNWKLTPRLKLATFKQLANCRSSTELKVPLADPAHEKQTDLRFHIQQSDFVLLVDLVDGLGFGAEHVSLETAILQQLIRRDALGHGFIGDEEVLLSIGIVLSLGSGGVCEEAGETKERPDENTAIVLKAAGVGGLLTWYGVGKLLRVFGQ